MQKNNDSHISIERELYKHFKTELTIPTNKSVLANKPPTENVIEDISMRVKVLSSVGNMV